MSGSTQESGILTVRGLTRHYRGAREPALHGVDIDLAPGEILALVGASGCGKTTLLRLIAGLDVPDAGTVSIGGELMVGPGVWVPPERRGVGMVFQDLALFPHLRVADNITFGLGKQSAEAKRRRAEELLEMAGLAGLGQRFPHQLSGGQQQRVALLRSLAPRPRLILLDEPFSSLDAPLRATLRAEVDRLLRETGVPAIAVLHDADDVFALADRAVALRAGRVVQVGAPEALYRNPSDEYVARLLGDINLLPAQYERPGLFSTPLGPLEVLDNGAPSLAVQYAGVRPEDLVIEPDSATGCRARVLRVHPFRGGVRLTVHLDTCDTTLCCELREAAATSLPAPGQSICLAARADRLRLLAGPETPPPGPVL